ncbi:hypothetical protein Taro_011691 [Colocasia esculenta]|uniref:non-specific serine/threonine protein kinase n=1 Tax=Colocasia esculenta TaxID=4460 RepID=A0A843UBD9_COLES|nr:hypothetical protein [Colocasia esculenta]
MMCALLSRLILLLIAIIFVEVVGAFRDVYDFTYNGFSRANLSLDGIAEVSPNGLLLLTNFSRQNQGHAFYSFPLRFGSSPGGGNISSSFSTTFVFAIVPEYSDLGGHEFAFALSPTRGRPGSLPVQYLGLFNKTDNGNPSNHVLAVELDTVYSREFKDIDDNHVGIDVNGLQSIESKHAAYFSHETGRYTNLTLMRGDPVQVWIEYDGAKKLLNVTLCPAGDRSSPTNHYILGWSFKMNGEARPLDLSRLPPLPPRRPRRRSKLFEVAIALAVVLILAAVVFGALVFILWWRNKFQEIREDWEAAYASQRFSYRELYVATKGFSDKQLLGTGGFGGVYRGTQIVSIGQLRHRNLVPLLGYSRRKGELLLVYEFMSNGSLDKHLFDQPHKSALHWSQRFRIIKGIALALHHLHEGWEQVVIHRDVKASNVLLDGGMNGRLGDFGLARLYDHGSDPRTTHVVGTLGYLAPEVPMTGKSTTSADVFAFGALVLEIACGRRTVEVQGPPEQASEVVLVDWVSRCWGRGVVLEASDPNLRGDFVVEEMELALRLGLICSHPDPAMRPSMRQVIQYLEGNASLPEMSKYGGADTGPEDVDVNIWS